MNQKNEIKIQKTLVTTPSAVLYPPTKNSRAAGRLNGNNPNTFVSSEGLSVP
jgi:hypothetical protein